MARQIANMFTSYELTDEELRNGGSFTTIQIQVLQNQLAMIAQEKTNLTFDHNNPVEYAKQLAYKQAELDVYTHLIATSEYNQDESNFIVTD